ncbi:hypothetical protein [Haladaptatus sp. DYF46]|uniref:tetratricopeptide repeat protein n=1 Tax=Haladaptatus sp. DYF46 TaxID=2886041 RepID=UPI001E4C43EA|nr:hypothetical protein [Haladaptatus sp. DYF46]
MSPSGSIPWKLIGVGLKIGGDILRDRIRTAEISDSISHLDTKFHTEFRDQLRRVADDNDEPELLGIAYGWDVIAKEVSDVEISTSSAEEAVEILVTKIESYNETELNETSRQTLKRCLLIAYQETVSSFCSKLAGTDLGAELQIAQGNEVLEQLHDLEEKLSILVDQAGPFRPYTIFDMPEDHPSLRSFIKPSSETEYISRDSLPELSFTNKTLLLAPKGSGKTRTIHHLLKDIPDVDYVFVPNNISDPMDTKNISYENFEGDVLLLWDDLQNLEERGSAGAFNSVINRLETNLSDSGHELHIFVTSDSGNISAIPGDPINEQGLWKEFMVVRVNEWNENSTKQLTQQVIDRYDIEIGDSTIDILHDQAQGSVAPLYLEIIGKQYQGKSLTRSEILELPKTLEKMWESHHQGLQQESENQIVLLESCKLLYDLTLPPIDTLVEGIFREIFGREKREFDLVVNELHQKGWLEFKKSDSPIETGKTYQIHATQLQAVQRNAENYSEEIIEFFTKEVNSYLPNVPFPDKRAITEIRLAVIRGLDILGIQIDDMQELLIITENEAPDIAEILTHLAEYYSNKDSKKMESIYERAISADPITPFPYHSYGVNLGYQNRRDEAINQFEAAISIDESFGPAYYGKAWMMFEELKSNTDSNINTQEMVDNIMEAISLQRYPVKSLNLVGDILRHKNRLDLSVKLLKRAERIDPEWPFTYVNLSLAWRDKGEQDKAIETVQRGIDRIPTSQQLLSHLGSLLIEDGELEMGREKLRESLEIDKYNAHALINLGHSYEGIDNEKGLKYITKARELIDIDPIFMRRTSIPKYRHTGVRKY